MVTETQSRAELYAPRSYGALAVAIDKFELPEWHELMHYLYLPVKMPGTTVRLPDRLTMFGPMIQRAMTCAPHDRSYYVYLTVRRGFATPDNPLNRPGWHCDGFGTDDWNFTWCDRWGTRFAEQTFHAISDDHRESMRQFEEQIDERLVRVLPEKWLYRLTPYVVHATPDIPPPGGMRSFVKVSVSYHRYNLLGNSHNYLFDYDWKLWPRDAARNDPAYSQADFYADDPQQGSAQ